MHTLLRSSLTFLLAFPILAAGQTPHGSEEKDKMGPVAFLWPPDRVWDDDTDNVGPCGSNAAVQNRTDFPLTNGAVALTIADEAWRLMLRIAYEQKPAEQGSFRALTTSVPDLDPGHQCYTLPELPAFVKDGDNATIQMEYWAVDDGRNQSLYACADITFIPASQMMRQVPCFNVTSDTFVEPSPPPKQSAGERLVQLQAFAVVSVIAFTTAWALA